MPFEVFDKQTAAATKAPMATVQRRGPISLNKAAHELMGAPEAVELLFDREQRLIGLRPTPLTNPRAFPVRPQGPKAGTLMVAGQLFAKHYGIDTTKARRYPVEMRDDVLIIDLKGDSIEVSSPRAKDTESAEAQ